MPLLAQCFGQTHAQILGRLATRVLTHLVALLREGRRFFEQLLSDRLTVERLYFAELADRTGRLSLGTASTAIAELARRGVIDLAKLRAAAAGTPVANSL